MKRSMLLAVCVIGCSAISSDVLSKSPQLPSLLECRSLDFRAYAFEPGVEAGSSVLYPPGWSENASEWKSISLLSTTDTPEGIDVVETLSAVKGGAKEHARNFRVEIFSDNQVLVTAVYVTSVKTYNFFRLDPPENGRWGLIMTASWAPYGAPGHSLMIVSKDCS